MAIHNRDLFNWMLIVVLRNTRNELASLDHSFYTSINLCTNCTKSILLIVLYKSRMMLHSRLYNRLIYFTRIYKKFTIILLRRAACICAHVHILADHVTLSIS